MENIGNIILGIMIPFVGTTLGAACVYFMKKGIRQNVEKGLLGFASGVMVAASVWSLLIPSMNLSADLGRLAFLPARPFAKLIQPYSYFFAISNSTANRSESRPVFTASSDSTQNST